MKKISYALLFICLFIFPFKIKAANIDSLNITGNGTAKSGEEVFITLAASTSGYNPNEGIWLVYTNLTYDRSHLALTWITSPGYNTVVQYNDNGALFASEVIENSDVNGMCVNGLLHCGTYTLTLRFQGINIKESINIPIVASEFGIGTLDIKEERDYTFDDIIETTYSNPVSHSLLIEPNINTIEEKPPVVVPEKPKSDEITKSPTTIPIATKSSNSYLKSLEITNYNFDFNKNTTNYTISIDSGVTSLEIKPVVEHAKASYKIVGNENLQDGSVIKIIVTAENGKTKEYTVSIKKEKKIVEENKNEQNTEEKKEKLKLSFSKTLKKVIMVISGIIGLFVIIGLICVINDIRENRRLDKLLKDDE